jgi:TolB-like protein
MMDFRDFLVELRRRRVIRVIGMYIVVAWVGLQVADLVFPAIDVSEAALRFVWAGFILAFPLVILFAWRYDITPSGIVRTLPAGDHDDSVLKLQKTDYVIIAVLIGVVSVMAWQLSGQIRQFDADSAGRPRSGDLDAFTIAVLPLENVSGDESQAFFVDGMYDTLISFLSRISALKVISRTSASRFSGSDLSLLDIGRELGAANIIEGSVFRDGSQVRITVQLIDAASGQLRWSHIYDKKLEDVLRLQSELARTIAGEVQVLLTPEESAYLAATQQVRPDAFELYLKGRFHWYRFTPQDLEIAAEYFRSAIELDPGYAAAYVGHADALATPAHIGLTPASEVFPRSIELVEKALELDPLLAEAHDLSARFKFVWDFDWLGADRGFRESIRLKASHPDGRIVYSQFLGVQERWEESMEQVRKGLSLDPLNDWFRIELGARYSWMGHYDDALEVFLPIAEEQPNWFMIYRYLWEAHFYRGDTAAALDAAKTYYALSEQIQMAEIASGFGGGTEFHEAMLALAGAMVAVSAESYVSELEIARLYAFAGDEEKTLHWLERAKVNRDSQLVYSVADPLFALVWDEPRYAELRKKMNLPATRMANPVNEAD